MRLICELSRQVNATSLRGKCYENTADANKHINSINYNDLIRTLNNINLTSVNQLTNSAELNATNQRNLEYYANKNDNAAMYVIIVLCFYSLSLVCLIFSNIKFNWVFKKSLGMLFEFIFIYIILFMFWNLIWFYIGLRNCYHAQVKTELYDTQQQETKETIELLFSHSSKLLSLPVVSFAQKQNEILIAEEQGKIKNVNNLVYQTVSKLPKDVFPPTKSNKPLKLSLI